MLIAAPDLELEPVSRLLVRDHVAKLVEGRERHAVRAHDQVAAERIGLTGVRDLMRSRAQSLL